MPRVHGVVSDIPETPVLLAIMRKRATEAVEMLDRSTTAGVDKLRDDLALSCVVEWVGRCAAAVPEAHRSAYPQLDWPRLVGHRPALLENYRDLDMNEVLAPIRDEFPQLIAELDAILGPEDDAP